MPIDEYMLKYLQTSDAEAQKICIFDKPSSGVAALGTRVLSEMGVIGMGK
ncbi:hypothetical protein [Noviherbaspirillum sp.]|nr:hypothetical protein [Noviherbaspirillum sp.]HJV83741.1 hypothetical protein [Noviherbaspirillum sp.]